MYQQAILLGHPNRIDSLALIEAGSFLPSLPASNIQIRQLSELARTQNANDGSFVLKGGFNLPKRVRIISAIAHNWTFTSKWRIRAARDAAFENLEYDSGLVDVWAGVVGSEWNLRELDWLSDNFWLGSLSQEQMEGHTPVAIHVAPGDVFAQYWQIEVFDSRNPAQYLEVGRIFLGEGIQSIRGYSYGAGLGYDDPTTVETTESGAEYFDRKEPLRSFRFTLDMMGADEAFGKMLELERRAGLSEEIFVIADPTDKRHGLRRNFMGRLRVLNPLEQMLYANGEDRHSKTFEIKETR